MLQRLHDEITRLRKHITRWVQAPKVVTGDLRRSHTCHAVGSQMIILGGYPPGHHTDPRARCDAQLVQVFDLSNWSVRTEMALLGEYNIYETKVQLRIVEH